MPFTPEQRQRLAEILNTVSPGAHKYPVALEAAINDIEILVFREDVSLMSGAALDQYVADNSMGWITRRELPMYGWEEDDDSLRRRYVKFWSNNER